MPIIQDKEFGNITIRRSPIATQIRIRVSPNGTLRASLPMRTPMFLVKKLIKNSRKELRELLDASNPKYEFKNGMLIGKSHTLIRQESSSDEIKVVRHGQQILVKLPNGKQLNDSDVSQKIRENVVASLRIEAKSYLPKRLSFLSEKFGLSYEKVRFSHASGRWGSYSSNGTVSLNIAIMKLPFELIDYIIIHELTHSKHMNHSKSFWESVGRADSNYREHRRALKSYNPSI